MSCHCQRHKEMGDVLRNDKLGHLTGYFGLNGHECPKQACCCCNIRSDNTIFLSVKSDDVVFM